MPVLHNYDRCHIENLSFSKKGAKFEKTGQNARRTQKNGMKLHGKLFLGRWLCSVSSCLTSSVCCSGPGPGLGSWLLAPGSWLGAWLLDGSTHRAMHAGPHASHHAGPLDHRHAQAWLLAATQFVFLTVLQF